MSVVPPQRGFRHAVTLLLTNRARAIAGARAPDEIRMAVERLARELISLADDVHATGAVSQWLIGEIDAMLERLPQPFDREAVKSAAAVILSGAVGRKRNVARRDLFLVYVPEDRLPVAAPLAIELSKRNVSVAFAEYEVTGPAQTATVVAHGLAHHCGGALLWTPAFQRSHPAYSLPSSGRMRVLPAPDRAETVAELLAYARSLRQACVKNTDT